MSALSSTRSISYRELVAFRQSYLDAFSSLSLYLRSKAPLFGYGRYHVRSVAPYPASYAPHLILLSQLLTPLTHITQRRHRQHRHARLPPQPPPVVLSFALPSSPFPYFSICEGTLCCVNGMGSLVRSLDGDIIRTEQYALIVEIWLGLT